MADIIIPILEKRKQAQRSSWLAQNYTDDKGGSQEWSVFCDSSLLLFLLNSDWVRESIGRKKIRLRKLLAHD